LVVERGLASRPTLSRFTAIMAQADNLKVLRDGVLQLAARGLRAENGGRKRPRVTLDVDSLPIEVLGHQPKAEWNAHYHARIYHP
ncbi:transposase, partial [Rhodovulum sp.]|uniref:transposase n=1 Tax=Rhodovulum sp. TaxID=34009 RepID=UPI00257CA966